VLFEAALCGMESAKSMKLCGTIQGKQLVILLDSGSPHTFLDAALADQLHGASSLVKSMSVRVANGVVLSCQTQLLNAHWQLQGLVFCSNFKVLPLQHFDMILGRAIQPYKDTLGCQMDCYSICTHNLGYPRNVV
jgi:hypothetical protein